MKNEATLKQISNQELKEELERRIKVGEWRINTETKKFSGNGEVEMIATLSFKDVNQQYLKLNNL
jgi:hypothetical protein